MVVSTAITAGTATATSISMLMMSTWNFRIMMISGTVILRNINNLLFFCGVKCGGSLFLIYSGLEKRFQDIYAV